MDSPIKEKERDQREKKLMLVIFLIAIFIELLVVWNLKNNR